MKKGLKIFLIVIVILVIIGIIIGAWFKKVFSNMGDVTNQEASIYFIEHEVKKEKLISTVKGNGVITSFNIQRLEVPMDAKVKERYVNDGEIVTAKKNLLKVLSEGYYRYITSPIDGMYFETSDINGNNYYVYDLNDIGVEMLVSEKDVAKLSLDQKANVKITALNKVVEGTVSYISKLPSEGSKFKVRVSIPYSDDLRFGYGTSVNIVLEEKENVLVIPYNALMMDKDDSYYVVKKDCSYDYYRYKMSDTSSLSKNCKTKVEVGIITSDNVEILEGLEEKDIVLEWDN